MTETSQEPFIVRAHHATRIYNILAMGDSIEEVLNFGELVDKAGPAGYHQDVFGTTEQESAETNQKIQGFFEDFLNLPDDATVRFVDGQRDGICNACVIGAHCESTRSESRFIRALGAVARIQGIERHLEVHETLVAGQKSPRKGWDMPAWAARQVLSDPEFHPQTLPALFRGPVRRMVAKQIANKEL
jgi:hypothetical protein